MGKLLTTIILVVFACIIIPWCISTIVYQGIVITAVPKTFKVKNAWNWYLGINRKSQGVPPFPGGKKGQSVVEDSPSTGGKPAQSSLTKFIGWSTYVGPGGSLEGLPFDKKPMVGCLYFDPNYTDSHGNHVNHYGTDFPMPMSTDVFNTMAGQVVYADWNGAFGNMIVIQNGVYQTIYAHLETIRVEQGQIVDSRTHIGDVGSTGNSTGPHLHYEIRQSYVNSYGSVAINNGSAPDYNESGGDWAWGNEPAEGGFPVPEYGSDLYNYLTSMEPPGISYQTVSPENFFNMENDATYTGVGCSR